MPDIQIITVKRPHSWLVKRDAPDRQCKTCGKFARQVATAACFEEEIEREIEPPNVG